MLDIGDINTGGSMSGHYCLFFLSFSALSHNYPRGMRIQCSSKLLEDHSPWTKSIPVLVCHPHPQGDAYGLKLSHFTPKNDSLTLTLLNRSANSTPLEVHMSSLTQLSCLELTPRINTSKEYKALTLQCHLSTGLAATAPINSLYQREELAVTPCG